MRWSCGLVMSLMLAGACASGDGKKQGSAGAADAAADAPSGPLASLGPVVVSEVMYHPVLENAADDNHEFIEIHNRSAADVMLGDWKLTGDVAFTFPPSTVIRPKQYLVIAKNGAKLSALYGLPAGTVVGNFTGTLDNGKGRFLLVDAGGSTVETMAYADEFPWPVSADALGASEGWLPKSLLPLMAHQYKGRSLERLNLELGAGEISNWDVSPVDGATPGKPNAGALTGDPPPVVEDLTVTPAGGKAGAQIRAGNDVTIAVAFSARGQVSTPQIEYFVDDIERTGEPTLKVAMTPMGAGTFTAVLPAQMDNAIVRYRVLGSRTRVTGEVISPRETDPYTWHAYFVSPVIDTQARVYQLFIARRDWGTLWDNLQEGHVVGCAATGPLACPSTRCEKSQKWNATVPAVFVYNGKVFDVLARYQGSRHNRRSGPTLAAWPQPGPISTTPMSPRVLSWSLKFPRFRSFEGKDGVLLNKLRNNVCLGNDSAFGARLYAATGIPVFAPRFVRFYVNGGYLHYMMEWIDTAETLMARQFKGQSLADAELFESKGYLADEGPYGWGDERQLEPYCSYTSEQRYAETYDKKLNDWKSHAELIALIDGLHQARAQGTPALRRYMDRIFDVPALLTYMAVRNWSGAWDDTYHNHLLIKRPDGKWLMGPWDVDFEYTMTRSRNSPYAGTDGDFTGLLGIDTWNVVKDSALKAYRSEYNQRMRELIAGPLSAAQVAMHVEAARADISISDANAAPATNYTNSMGMNPGRCDVEARWAEIKDFATARNDFVPGALKP